MSRHLLSLSPEPLTSLALDAFIAHTAILNQRNRTLFTTPLPKAPSRWISHYEFAAHPIDLTAEGDVDGGLSWLVASHVPPRSNGTARTASASGVTLTA